MALTRAAEDVLAERRRQIDVEGWTPQHDDGHYWGTLSAAAACYAVKGCADNIDLRSAVLSFIHTFWPWNKGYWRPTTHRRNLVKAGALILAEIERIDRTAQRDNETEG